MAVVDVAVSEDAGFGAGVTTTVDGGLRARCP